MTISVYGIKPYYVDNVSALYRNDTFEVLSKMTPESIDLILQIPRISCPMGEFPAAEEKRLELIKGSGTRSALCRRNISLIENGFHYASVF